MEYIIIFLISIYFSYLTEKRIDKNKGYIITSILAVMPLIIMAGIRDKYVGIDVTWYVEPSYIVARKAENLSAFFYEYGDGTDYGFCIFVYLITKIFGSFFWIMTFCHAIIVIGWFYFLVYFKKTYKISLTFGFAIILISQYNESLCLIRQSMATSIALLGYVFMLQRRYLYSIILCLVAFSFHQTIISFILAFIGFDIILRKITSVRNQYILLFLLFFFVIAFTSLLDIISIYVSEKYIERMTYTEGNRGGYITLYFYIFLVLLPFILKSKNKISSFLYLPVIGVVFLILSKQSQYLSRLAYPFMSCLMVTVPYRVQNKYMRFIIIIAFSVLWYVSIYIRKDWETVPYVIDSNMNFY